MRIATPILLLAALACSSSEEVVAPPLWNDLPSGSYRVGFRTFWEMDASRSFSGGQPESAGPRPLRIDVWYPTLDRGAVQPFSAYLDREEVPAGAKRAHEVVLGYDRWSYGGMSEAEGPPAALMSTPTAAIAEAEPAPGPFPLVVYVGGWYSRSSDNTVFAENLASRGFVVVTTPHLDRGLWEYDFSMDAATLETRARDVELVLAAAARLPEVDGTRIALGGYSAGGMVALLVAARADSVDAVFALDPAYLYDGLEVLETSSLLEPGDVRVPVLTLHSGHADWANRANFDLLDRLEQARVQTAAIPDATHGDFSDDVAIEVALGLISNPARPSDRGWAAYRSWLAMVVELLEETGP